MDVERLVKLLDLMNVPAVRKDLSVPANVLWLDRNLFIQNSGHPLFAEAVGILKPLAKQVKLGL